MEKLQVKVSNTTGDLFPNVKLVKRSWADVQKQLTEIQFLYKVKGLMVCGGFIFGSLFDCISSDIDIFLTQSTEKEAIKNITYIETLLNQEDIGERQEYRYYDIRCLRTANAITFRDNRIEYNKLKRQIANLDYKIHQIEGPIIYTRNLNEDENDKDDDNNNEDNEDDDNNNEDDDSRDNNNKGDVFVRLPMKELNLDEKNQIENFKNEIKILRDKCNKLPARKDYQIVLRLYKTLSEILHGFDVDCCAVGYDGKDIWMTKRALFAISHGYNTVNFERLSPSYGNRLVKYALRGMSIRIPNFDRKRVNLKALKKAYAEIEEKYTTNSSVKFANIKKLHGIDLLLFLEHHIVVKQFNLRSIRFLYRLDKETSDYSVTPHRDYSDSGNQIDTMLEYMQDSADRHVIHSIKYLPFLQKAQKQYEDIGNRLWVNNFFGYKSISYIEGDAHEIEHILHVPNSIYKCFEVVRPWEFPADVTFKIINPGEQMTNTFNRIVLKDNKVWYDGMFYCAYAAGGPVDG